MPFDGTYITFEITACIMPRASVSIHLLLFSLGTTELARCNGLCSCVISKSSGGMIWRSRQTSVNCAGTNRFDVP